MSSKSFHWPMPPGRDERTYRPTWRRSTLIVTAAAVLFAGLAAGGGSQGWAQPAAGVAATIENEPAPAREPYARLDPAAFEERMKKNEQAMVINVHIPYEGEIAGTDAFIPYNKIKGDSRLPEDKSTELLLYCRSGRMSEEAGVDLHEEGYTNIAHLEGGMKAWTASGRQVVYNPENAARQSGPHEMENRADPKP